MLSITSNSPDKVDADAVIVAVCAGPDGPQLAPGAKDVDDALGGTLADALTALGATGEAAKIPTGGRLAAPLVAAAGIGATEGGDAAIDPETLRRAAGAAVRAVASPRG